MTINIIYSHTLCWIYKKNSLHLMCGARSFIRVFLFFSCSTFFFKFYLHSNCSSSGSGTTTRPERLTGRQKLALLATSRHKKSTSTARPILTFARICKEIFLSDRSCSSNSNNSTTSSTHGFNPSSHPHEFARNGFWRHNKRQTCSKSSADVRLINRNTM